MKLEEEDLPRPWTEKDIECFLRFNHPQRVFAIQHAKRRSAVVKDRGLKTTYFLCKHCGNWHVKDVPIEESRR